MLVIYFIGLNTKTPTLNINANWIVAPPADSRESIWTDAEKYSKVARIEPLHQVVAVKKLPEDKIAIRLRGIKNQELVTLTLSEEKPN